MFEPILLRQSRPCDVCKIPTWWATPRQSVNGRCLDHIAGVDRPVTSAGERLARSIVRAAFPETTVAALGAPERYRRGVYPTWVPYVAHGRFYGSGGPIYARGWGLQGDAGPCVHCRFLIKRYGADGYPVCLDCEEGRS